MDPVSATMTLITGVNEAITMVSNLRDLNVKLNEAENKAKLADLYNALSDVKVNAADLKIELIDKDEKIKSLENALKLKTEMKWEDPFYFRFEADGSKHGPFCQKCFDAENKAIRLPKTDSAWFLCKACGSSYENENVDRNRYSASTSGGSPNGWMSR